jgi:hypothetical protein
MAHLQLAAPLAIPARRPMHGRSSADEMDPMTMPGLQDRRVHVECDLLAGISAVARADGGGAGQRTGVRGAARPDCAGPDRGAGSSGRG